MENTKNFIIKIREYKQQSCWKKDKGKREQSIFSLSSGKATSYAQHKATYNSEEKELKEREQETRAINLIIRMGVCNV